jgi:hypothetical protein
MTQARAVKFGENLRFFVLVALGALIALGVRRAPGGPAPEGQIIWPERGAGWYWSPEIHAALVRYSTEHM